MTRDIRQLLLTGAVAVVVSGAITSTTGGFLIAEEGAPSAPSQDAGHVEMPATMPSPPPSSEWKGNMQQFHDMRPADDARPEMFRQEPWNGGGFKPDMPGDQQSRGMDPSMMEMMRRNMGDGGRGPGGPHDMMMKKSMGDMYNSSPQSGDMMRNFMQGIMKEGRPAEGHGAAEQFTGSDNSGGMMEKDTMRQFGGMGVDRGSMENMFQDVFSDTENDQCFTIEDMVAEKTAYLEEQSEQRIAKLKAALEKATSASAKKLAEKRIKNESRRLTAQLDKLKTKADTLRAKFKCGAEESGGTY